MKRLLKHSAIVRYFSFNARVGLFTPADARQPKRTSPRLDEEVFSKAAMYLVGKMQAEVPKAEIVLVTHPSREEIYHRRQTTLAPYARWFKAAADSLGCGYLDWSPAFANAYRTDSMRFDYHPVELHWNSRGHRLCATALADYLQRSGTLQVRDGLPTPHDTAALARWETHVTQKLAP